MKKILLLVAAVALLSIAVSCSNDDEPKRGNGVFTVNTSMINHVYNTTTGQVMGIASTHNKLTLDTVNHKASLQLNYNDGANKTLAISDIKATPKRLGFYTLSSPTVTSFSGYVDFNEGSMRYSYTTADGIRVISTIPEVFFLKTDNVITYDDTTKATTMQNTMYQFNLTPNNNTAVVKVMGIVHAKDWKYFINMTAASVPVTVTATGYTFDGENLKTTSIYRTPTDTITGATTKTTDKYPFKTFHADVDLVHDSINATFMMGGSATVVARGRTYPDYTAY